MANGPTRAGSSASQEVKDKSGWGSQAAQGAGQGIAVANWGMGGKPDAGTTVATVAKVEVTKGGNLKILQLDLAFDTGKVFNEDAVRAEMEGGTLFGLNMALNEGLNIQDGQIVEGNFDQYPMIRMADTPPKSQRPFRRPDRQSRFNEVGEPPAGIGRASSGQRHLCGDRQADARHAVPQTGLELDVSH